MHILKMYVQTGLSALSSKKFHEEVGQGEFRYLQRRVKSSAPLEKNGSFTERYQPSQVMLAQIGMRVAHQNASKEFTRPYFIVELDTLRARVVIPGG